MLNFASFCCCSAKLTVSSEFQLVHFCFATLSPPLLLAVLQSALSEHRVLFLCFNQFRKSIIAVCLLGVINFAEARISCPLVPIWVD